MTPLVKGYECLDMGYDIYPLNVRKNKKKLCVKKGIKTWHDVVAINEGLPSYF